MSGIVGILNLDGAPVERDLLQVLTERMAFRGPDGTRVWAEGAIGFGHTLLRTADESEHEQQPLSLDGQVWIVADGRVDARQELFARLKRDDRAPDDLARTPDAELLLRAYLAWGEDCVRRLIGEFCFAIWDGRSRTLFCARDRFGVKLCYYAQVGNTLIVGNTLECLLGHPAVSDRLDERVLGDLFLFGMNQDAGSTVFADVRKLPPGHTLRVAGNIAVQRPYWSLEVRDLIRYRRAGEYIGRFHELFEQAVGDRLRTSKVAVVLSGGLDSTSVAATAQAIGRKRGQSMDMRAFTMVFEGMLQDDERRFTDEMASSLGIPIEYLSAVGFDLFSMLGRKEFHPPEPYLNSVLAIKAFTVNGVLQGRYSTVLSGHGADFGLYSWYMSVGGALSVQPLAGAMTDIFRTVRHMHRLPDLGFGTKAWLRGALGRTEETRQPSSLGYLDEGFARRNRLPERWDEVMESRKALLHAPRQAGYQACMSPTATAILEWYDPGVSGLPLEFEFPFMDVRLMEYLLALPPLPWCADKAILRLAMRDRLPRAILERPKTAFRQNPTFDMIARGGNLQTALSAMPELDPYVRRSTLLEGLAQGPGGNFWEAPLLLRVLSLGAWLRTYRQA